MDNISTVTELRGVEPSEETGSEDISTASYKTPITEHGGVEPLEETTAEDIYTASDETPITEIGDVEPIEETAAEDNPTASYKTPDVQLIDIEKVEEKDMETIAPDSVTDSDARPGVSSETEPDVYPPEIVNWEFLIPEKFQIQDDSSEEIDTATNFKASTS